jgi:undecaprenyl-diphosphatase
MLESLIDLDKKVFVFLNGLGSETFDPLWEILTVQFYWAPFFAVILYLAYQKLGLKNFAIGILFIAVLILICDQSANFFKDNVQRLRPCNDPEINGFIRIGDKKSGTYSFFSGHATNSMATTMFVFLLLRRHYKHIYLLFLFPLIFAYSRIYLGLHFPLDILAGYTYGGTFGYLFYRIFIKYVVK